MKIAVCDDDTVAVQTLFACIREYLDSKQIAYCLTDFYDGESLLSHLTYFDLIFLDIHMGRINGLETAKSIKKHYPHSSILFVTALKEYVFDAFEVCAIGYLVKPFDRQKLFSALARFLAMNQKQDAYLITQNRNRVLKIAHAQITYCEVYNHSIIIHTVDGKEEFYGRIEDLEKELGHGFYRCHRSYLVNLSMIERFQDGMIQMINGESIPVAVRRQTEFLRCLLRQKIKEVQ